MPSLLCWKTFFMIARSDFESSYACLILVQPLHLQKPGTKRLQTNELIHYGDNCYNEDEDCNGDDDEYDNGMMMRKIPGVGQLMVGGLEKGKFSLCTAPVLYIQAATSSSSSPSLLSPSSSSSLPSSSSSSSSPSPSPSSS